MKVIPEMCRAHQFFFTVIAFKYFNALETEKESIFIFSISTTYRWLLINTTDPMGQLNWLIDILQNAESKNEKVDLKTEKKHSFICIRKYTDIVLQYKISSVSILTSL
jgi:hypothetical protein